MGMKIKQIYNVIYKYRYAFLVLGVGLVLMLIPSALQTKTSPQSSQNECTVQESDIETELEQILEQVDGAGEVHVFLTIDSGAETIYQTDNSNSANGNDQSTVTVTDSQRNQSGLIRQITSAHYRGAIIVCDGAEDPSVRLAIVDAVSKITGLGANQIAVLKLK